jgi:dTDP-4-amino-4,6-dideoxygalactose transaminase
MRRMQGSEPDGGPFGGGEEPGGGGVLTLDPAPAEAERDVVPFVDLQGEYRLRKAEIDAAIQRVLARSDFILGEAVSAFEEDFAALCGVRHAVGVDSGFSALELILRAHDVGPGDEVITAANTFVATVGAIEAVGARPVLVDVLSDRYTIDPDQVRAAITPATRAIMPVHLYGQPAEMDAILGLAQEHGLHVFEDACQAHGARYHGRRAGSLGDAAAFSFYPSKNLGAFGDGGIVTVDDDAVAARLRELRNLGMSVKYRHDTRGFNRRLDTIHAAVLGVKLRYLDEDNGKRRTAAQAYGELLAKTPIATPMTVAGTEHVFHLYVVEVDDREQLQAHLASAGVATGIHYPIPIHLQAAYTELGCGPGTFPVTERAAQRILSLPMFPTLSSAQLTQVVGAVDSYFAGGQR